ncbi:MAG: polysaccharide deacetylase family protein, partial [Pseudorhodoplanes sp.]
GVLSTFFMIGRKLEDEKNAALLPAIKAAGHRIGNHTLTHSVPFGDKPSAEFAIEEIERTQELLGDFAETDKLFRPYGKLGRLGPHVFSRASLKHLRDNNYTAVTWTTIPGDMFNADWDRDFEQRFLPQPWSVVVLHDVENSCLPHLSDFISKMKDDRYTFTQELPEEIVVTRAGRFVNIDGLVADGVPA